VSFDFGSRPCDTLGDAGFCSDARGPDPSVSAGLLLLAESNNHDIDEN
jgi:hypothetical protein